VAGEIIVPHTVLAECVGENVPVVAAPERPGAAAISAAVVAGLLTPRDDREAIAKLGPLPMLDAGEAAAIALALELHGAVLMDERLGRSVAKRHHLPIIGSAGVLLAAKQRGLLPAVKPILEDWQAMGYYLSAALLQEVLARAGETGA